MSVMKGAGKDGPHQLDNHAGVSVNQKKSRINFFYLPLPNSEGAVGLLAGWEPFGSPAITDAASYHFLGLCE